MSRLTTGDTAPNFQLPDASGNEVSLSDYAGRKVIVYFYPAALTPGCTTEAVDFTAAAPDLDKAGYAVVGISPDAPAKLTRFAEKHSLRITLLSDPERTTIQAYGAWGERSMYGKKVTGVIRSTFVVEVSADGKGRIESAQYGVRATGHVNRLRESLLRN